MYYDYGSPIYKWKNWITNGLNDFSKFILAQLSVLELWTEPTALCFSADISILLI